MYINEKAKIMEGYGPQLPQLTQYSTNPTDAASTRTAAAKPRQPSPARRLHGCQAPPQSASVFQDGVILASEKRVTYGYFIMSKGGKKVFKVTDQIGVACAGLVGDMQILAKEMEAQANLYSMDVGRHNQRTFSSKTYG